MIVGWLMIVARWWSIDRWTAMVDRLTAILYRWTAIDDCQTTILDHWTAIEDRCTLRSRGVLHPWAVV
jgi:hypothetical protein